MKTFIVLSCLLACAFAATFVPSTLTWSDCGSGAHFKATNVTMSPDPPTHGDSVTVTAVGTNDEALSGGDWSTKVKLGPITVGSFTGKVCDAMVGCKCPCPAGQQTSATTLTVPAIAPKGTYKGQFTATDQNGNQLMCIAYTFQMS
mmetsp:Transcript_30081/g.75719  ORF Transcript_30081/g.75719 Transcript_30081/m.75719 type:complete len:146 (-) Transcript_30081:121-558(-)|eukprot:CAMPEP_0177672082 /NCGR_PEP_ID=MMETSP0447-20121125/25111_1 /TAXON_ID=0 /ORGANISM="Stygamoeba regulata, Strain BSH-02190019" /LENGTH=145 /DNA_ID=CAMNT_0019179645 /DNA_START=12 /DNA_END=449 /DNA_ORIENTATION=+